MRRIQQALRLKEAGVPLAHIASRSGFHDQPHFTRAFKAMLGFTPLRMPQDRIDWGRTPCSTCCRSSPPKRPRTDRRAAPGRAVRDTPCAASVANGPPASMVASKALPHPPMAGPSPVPGLARSGACAGHRSAGRGSGADGIPERGQAIAHHTTDHRMIRCVPLEIPRVPRGPPRARARSQDRATSGWHCPTPPWVSSWPPWTRRS
ncbi:helix-turn-helix domain-containing protein [Streptacidiphilus sp. 4-A2]|nr:helix-turn-helix domain-containing protein [Streptacidiphilus sp. 4-A2]